MELYQAIETYSRLHDVPPALVKAIIKRETGFKENIPVTIEPDGTRSYGLMQINETTARDLAVNDLNSLLRTKENIFYGTKHLHWLMDQFPDVRDVISAWQVGASRVQLPYKNPDYVSDVYRNFLLYSMKTNSVNEISTSPLIPLTVVAYIMTNLDAVTDRLSKFIKKNISWRNRHVNRN